MGGKQEGRVHVCVGVHESKEGEVRGRGRGRVCVDGRDGV